MQVSVIIPDEWLASFDAAVSRDCRTRSGQAAFYIIDALRREGASAAKTADPLKPALEPWPPPRLPTDPDAAAARLVELREQRALLEAQVAEAKCNPFKTAPDSTALRDVAIQIDAIENHLRALGRLKGARYD